MQIIGFQSVFDTPTAKESRLNSLGMTQDGRIWEYLKATEAISQYMVVSNPANTDTSRPAISGSSINFIKRIVNQINIGCLPSVNEINLQFESFRAICDHLK